jgi:hypothetical protein
MEKTEAEVNQADYYDFLAVLNQIFLEALRLADADQAPEVQMKSDFVRATPKATARV